MNKLLIALVACFLVVNFASANNGEDNSNSNQGSVSTRVLWNPDYGKIRLNYQADFWQNKAKDLDKFEVEMLYQKALGIKRLGKRLTFMGTGAAIVGVGVLVSAVNSAEQGNFREYENKSLAGLILIHGGTALSSVGVVNWIIGGVKVGKYERMKMEYSLNLNSQGVGLAFNF
jgi:hypothetical protein